MAGLSSNTKDRERDNEKGNSPTHPRLNHIAHTTLPKSDSFDLAQDGLIQPQIESVIEMASALRNPIYEESSFETLPEVGEKYGGEAADFTVDRQNKRQGKDQSEELDMSAENTFIVSGFGMNDIASDITSMGQKYHSHSPRMSHFRLSSASFSAKAPFSAPELSLDDPHSNSIPSRNSRFSQSSQLQSQPLPPKQHAKILSDQFLAVISRIASERPIFVEDEWWDEILSGVKLPSMQTKYGDRPDNPPQDSNFTPPP